MGKGDEKMKKNDKQTLEMLQKEFEKSAESAQIPLRLQKESMVAMLKSDEGKETDFSDKTGTKKNNIVVLRRLTAAAAMLAIVVVGALLMRTGGVKVIKTDSFYKSYESVEPVRNARSYEEVEQAVREILGGKQSAADSTKETEKTNNSTQTTAENVINRLLEGYSKYVADTNAEGKTSVYVSETPAVQSSSEVVAVYGDFKADIVKNDGEYLYVVTTGVNSQTGATVEQIKIVKAEPAEEMKVVSTIVLSNGESSSEINECLEIYLKNDTLIALMSSYSYSLSGSVAYDDVSTAAVYYDISEPTAPVKLREHKQDGKYVSSSLHESRFALVTAKSIPSLKEQSDISESGAIPSFSIDGVSSKLKAEDIFIAVNDPEASYLFITVTDISDLEAQIGRLAVLGSGKEIYCSAHSIVIARGFVSLDADKNGAYESLTELYRFNINGSSIGFSGSYVVKGSIVGGISVDEESGNLKVVTSEASANNIFILNDKMEFVSGLTDIFPNKKITGVKFIGSNAYVVINEDSEKTMIVDLSDPSKPKAAGTISTKGFSDELYAVSDNLLIGIGTALPEGSGELSMTLSLFDVSDPYSPKAVSVYTLEGGCSIPAVDDSRSVMTVSDKKMFGIPVVKNNPTTGTDISSYILFNAENGAITPVGTYNHDTAYTGDAAVRGSCIGDALFTVSGEKIVAFSIDECELLSSLEIR